MSAEIKNDRAIDWARVAGVGERRFRRDGIRLDSAPEVETLPISSWLKSAMQLTLPSRVGNSWAEAVSAMASTAQNLDEHES